MTRVTVTRTSIRYTFIVSVTAVVLYIHVSFNDEQKNQNIVQQIEAAKSVSLHKEDLPTIPHFNASVSQNATVNRWILPDSANSTSTQEILSRRRRVEKVCQTTLVSGKVHGVFTHRSGVIYCYVPKAGCTFWKRVFTA
ncbi:carbohydrate sulfotransferase 8, partial [Biomphalaria glabrata]